VGIEFDVENWLEIRPGSGRVELLVFPLNARDWAKLERQLKARTEARVLDGLRRALSDLPAATTTDKAIKRSARELVRKLFQHGVERSVLRDFWQRLRLAEALSEPQIPAQDRSDSGQD